MSETDVIVIGAGAAGLSGARALMAAGLSVQVIEADTQIGGRAKTDTAIFGVPYDLGAHWLHSAESNDFAAYGRLQGFDIYPAPEAGVMYVGDRPATGAERTAFRKASDRARKAISQAGAAGRDVAAADVIAPSPEWGASVDWMLGAYEMGIDTDGLSCVDWYSVEGGADAYCRQGFGALLAHSARDMAVTLNTPAQALRWSGPGVEVTTPRGVIRARAALVTVSIGVLASGAIRFDPALPPSHEAALGGLEMGHYNHVALRFSHDVTGIGTDGFFSFRVEADANGIPQGFGGLIDAGGTGISYFDLGGRLAKSLSQAGPGAASDYVIDRLTRIFGAGIETALLGHHSHDWSAHPLTRGAYAVARPGHAQARKPLHDPVGERIWFAGEALSPRKWATVAGAHESGRSAAAGMIAALA